MEWQPCNACTLPSYETEILAYHFDFCIDQEKEKFKKKNAFCKSDHKFGSQSIACKVFAKPLLQAGRNSRQRSQQDQLDSGNRQTYVDGNYT